MASVIHRLTALFFIIIAIPFCCGTALSYPERVYLAGGQVEPVRLLLRYQKAVDRLGGKVTGQGDKFDEWRTMKNAIDYCAERLQTRLAAERAK